MSACLQAETAPTGPVSTRIIFNFLSKMCLGAMRRARLPTWLASARRVRARVIVAGS